MATSEFRRIRFIMHPWLPAALVLSFIIAGGCRRSSFETVPVQGTVSYQGRPAPYGMVSFRPVDASRGRSAVASIRPDGTYVVETLKDSRGLLPGEYAVTVSLIKPPGLEEKPSAVANSVQGLPVQPLCAPNLTVDAGDGAKVFNITLDGK